MCAPHLADLIQGVLSISSSVFEVVMSWECPVNVPGDGTVLRGLLTRRQKEEVDDRSERKIQSLKNPQEVLLDNYWE